MIRSSAVLHLPVVPLLEVVAAESNMTVGEAVAVAAAAVVR